MKKTLIALILLVFVLPLSVFGIKTLQGSIKPQAKEIGRPNLVIKKNQNIWKKRIVNADVIKSDGFNNGKSYVGTTMDQLDNHSKAVIKGTVYNLQRMNSPKNMAYTKATIHIDKVLSGDTQLKGKNIYIAFEGGLVSFDHWYANMSKPKDFDHEMLVKNEEFPLPDIGSKIIAGLVPNHLDEATDYNMALKQSGFTIHNSYMIDVPQYNFWIKRPDADKYVLNNPKALKKSNDRPNLAAALEKLTTEINQKYNNNK
ncbi:hypothetical protein [Companilactobacillus halodurans]|uniref:Uncharacterized protein n=1 Tax=Companilactobacillus halodurans TaxID=2584183 RepID=A0A5P0ZY03_9LACO|nr:hypothetical protein [Companilactobacillus halodurans]MQS75265.1 hypothetical protein [Companilactobacillus halodurans]MQS97614.1 hypothetical protein [Companilactobacillus halodurans]